MSHCPPVFEHIKRDETLIKNVSLGSKIAINFANCINETVVWSGCGVMIALITSIAFDRGCSGCLNNSAAFWIKTVASAGVLISVFPKSFHSLHK